MEDLLVLLGGHKGDGETLGTETSSTTDTVEVGIGISGHVVVDSEVDPLDIDTTAENVGGHADTLVELLELFVSLDTLLLADTGVDGNRREVALAEELIQLGSAQGAFDEDDNLVELEVVQELVQLTVLLPLFKGKIVLLQAVERQLGILIDVVLGGVLHELPANGLDLVGQSGRKHHHLLLLRSSTEDLLHVTAHV